MRKDMAKVIVERPRLGAGWGRKGRGPRRLDDHPLSEAGRHRTRSKVLNENLAPLRRYLQAQVNRPWSKVYAEIRLRIKPGNTVQEHILGHVGDFIWLDVEHVAADGRNVCGITQKPHKRGRFLHVAPGDLYVDPRDGIIKRARRKVSAS